MSTYTRDEEVRENGDYICAPYARLNLPRPTAAQAIAGSVRIMTRAAGFYLLSWACLIFGVLLVQSILGYTPTASPLKDDHPEPVMYGVIGCLFGPYIFWVLAVAGYALSKQVNRKNIT